MQAPIVFGLLLAAAAFRVRERTLKDRMHQAVLDIIRQAKAAARPIV